MDKYTVDFLICAKKATYAGKGAESAPSRPCSHDLEYSQGDMTYIDTYLGGERFAGEEALWKNGKPFWSMNYIGRVTGDGFSGDFLKEALLRIPTEMPYRGPSEYSEGEYTYKCEVTGDHDWFHGREIICRNGIQIYECIFHGGAVR